MGRGGLSRWVLAAVAALSVGPPGRLYVHGLACASNTTCQNKGTCSNSTPTFALATSGYCCACTTGFQGDHCNLTGADVACSWCIWVNQLGQNVTQNDCPSGTSGAIPASLDIFPLNVVLECYHGDTKVHRQGDAAPVKIKEVTPGDMVLSYSEETGEVEFSRVFLLAHADPSLEATFTWIDVVPLRDDGLTVTRQSSSMTAVREPMTGHDSKNDSDGTGRRMQRLTLTPKHYVYTSQGERVEAGQVVPGDLLLMTSPHGRSVVPGRVAATGRVQARGVYNPVTAAGTIVAADTITSVYANDIPPVSPRAAHLLLWPLRAMSPWQPHLDQHYTTAWLLGLDPVRTLLFHSFAGA